MSTIEQKSFLGQNFVNQCFSSRRTFLRGSAAITAGSAFWGVLLPETAQASESAIGKFRLRAYLDARSQWRDQRNKEVDHD